MAENSPGIIITGIWRGIQGYVLTYSRLKKRETLIAVGSQQGPVSTFLRLQFPICWRQRQGRLLETCLARRQTEKQGTTCRTPLWETETDRLRQKHDWHGDR